MSKRLILILALAFVVGIAFAAYAEVQNVKVSGDLTVKGVNRRHLDLRSSSYPAATFVDHENNFLSILRIRIDADLTDNVSAVVRLINERDWDGDDENTSATAGDDDKNNIEVDLAYANLKEFLYSPLSLTIGRQELRYGNALVVGDPDTNGRSAGSHLTQDDLSLRKSFDAIKAVLNYDPLVIDVVYAKVDENVATGANANDDTDLYGINANYALTKNTILEGYFFTKIIGSNATALQAAANTSETKADKVYTIGTRVANTSIKNLMLSVEGAIQLGTYNPKYDINALAAAETDRRRAWALQVIAAYNLVDKVPAKLKKYKPFITGTYTYLSGEDSMRTSGAYHGWDAMYEDQTTGHLMNRILGFTNAQVIVLNGKIVPVEDVTLDITYANQWLNKRFQDGISPCLRNVTGAQTFNVTRNRHVGQELDASLTYDYTEDVQFNLLSGVFFPGDMFSSQNDTKATEVIGSMKVVF